MTDREPIEVWSLAEYLFDEMDARGWTTIDVAKRMDGRDGLAVRKLIIDMILCVQEDNATIDEETFEDLARAFDVSAALFKNLDATWRKYPDRRVAFDPPERIFA